MIERARFGRTGHESTRTIFGAAALSNASPADADRALALLDVCAQRDVAVQTIKSITLGPWTVRPPDAHTWYEPLTEQRDIDLAVRFVLGRERLFLNTASDIDLLVKVLDAASRGGTGPSDREMDALLEGRGMTPLFA